MNALRRFKYRQLLRIGARDLLGDADLAATTEELSRPRRRVPRRGLAHGARPTRAPATARRSTTRAARPGSPIIGMGKLGGEELNYSSDIDLMFVYGADGETAGGPRGPRCPTASTSRASCRDIVGHARGGHRRGLRLPRRPAPAAGGARRARSPSRSTGYRALPRRARRAVGAAGAAQGAACRRATQRWARGSSTWRARSSTAPGLDARVVPAIRGMKREIDASLDAATATGARAT